MKRNISFKGFTLVELLIVLSIIGILSAVVIASTSQARAGARDTRRVSDMKEIQLALAVYYDVNKQYPTALSTLADPGQKFIPAIPTDPLSGSSYEYLSSSPYKSYCIGVTLEVPSSQNDSSSCSTGGTANYKAQSAN